MADSSDLIIGIDAGTSVIKAVAFDLGGRQLATSSVRNAYVWAPMARPRSRCRRPGPIAPPPCAGSPTRWTGWHGAPPPWR